MSKFKPKADANNVESRVTSKETLVSSPISNKEEDNSHQTSMAVGSLHDPTPVEEEVVQESPLAEVEMTTPRVEDLTDEDYKIDFPESDEHMVCLLSARLPVLRDDESNRTLQAIRRFYEHPESYMQALGTLLHAALVTRRLIFGLSSPDFSPSMKLVS